jgi:hypothetical protein
MRTVLGYQVCNDDNDACCYLCGNYIMLGESVWLDDDDHTYCMTQCLEEIADGTARYQSDIDAELQQRWEDHQDYLDSLSDHEMYYHMRNENPYGMEGGY